MNRIPENITIKCLPRYRQDRIQLLLDAVEFLHKEVTEI